MLTKNDLRIVPYDTELIRIINTINVTDLFVLIENWLKIPELRGAANDWESYDSLTKASAIRQMTLIDWPEGLHMYQIGQIKLTQFTKSARKHWRILRLVGAMNKRLDMYSIRLKLEKYLSNFFICHVYASRDPDTEAYLFSLSIGEKEQEIHTILDMKFGYMIYFPETNLMITPNKVWNQEYDAYFRQSLSDTFSTDAIQVEPITVTKARAWHDIGQYRTSEGIFGGLQNNGIDANPLDIRQKRQMGSDVHVSNEQKRRIVPLDLDSVGKRYDEIETDLAWKSMIGHKRLYVNLKLPLDTGKPNLPSEFENEDINISITMVGRNVGEGIAEMIRTGKIENDPPLWLKSVSITGAKKLVVNSEGVFQEMRDE